MRCLRKSTVKKRSEHGLESRVLFLDLVKTFDYVPRKLLWSILLKYGVPNKLMNLLKALHSDFVVKYTIDDIAQTIRNTIGVKQGDILGPILFTFFIAAMISTWRINCPAPPCLFYSKNDAKITGRSFKSKGGQFELSDSEYAGDTAAIFNDRSDLVEGVNSIKSYFSRFGTETHTGMLHPRTSSKTEVLFCAKRMSFSATNATSQSRTNSHT